MFIIERTFGIKLIDSNSPFQKPFKNNSKIYQKQTLINSYAITIPNSVGCSG